MIDISKSWWRWPSVQIDHGRPFKKLLMQKLCPSWFRVSSNSSDDSLRTFWIRVQQWWSWLPEDRDHPLTNSLPWSNCILGQLLDPCGFWFVDGLLECWSLWIEVRPFFNLHNLPIAFMLLKACESGELFESGYYQAFIKTWCSALRNTFCHDAVTGCLAMLQEIACPQ